MDWSDDSNEIHEEAMRNWNGDVMYANRIATGSITADKIFTGSAMTPPTGRLAPKHDPDITAQTNSVTKAKRSPKRIDGEGKKVGHRWSIGTNLDYIWDGYNWKYERVPQFSTYEDKKHHEYEYTRSFEKFMGMDGARDHYSQNEDDALLHVQPKPETSKRSKITKGVVTADYTPFKEVDTAAFVYPTGTRWEQYIEGKLIASWYTNGETWVQDYKYYVTPPIQKHAEEHAGTTTLEEILKTSDMDLKDYNPRETYLNLLQRPQT